MFRQYRWDVRPLLRATDANELRITFASPVRYASEKQKARALPGVSQAIPGGPYLRKAPCQFGWDWGPQLPPVGIWKDLRLEGYTGARLEQVHLRQAHAGGQVTVEALVTGPELLIADEPTSMLDASLRVTVLNLLVDLRKRHNMGILFITHDLGQAYYVSDRILVMYHGELVEQGPVEMVLANPQHDYTKRLLADVPRLHGWGALLTPTH